MPSLVFDELVIGTEIHGHRPAAPRAVRHQFSWCAHVRLVFYHLAYNAPVVISLLMAGKAALEKAVIALSVEKPFLVKTGFLETVVHIGGYDEIVFDLYDREQVVIYRLRRVHIAVYPYIAAPICPIFFRRAVRIKTAGVHVVKSVFFLKIRKVFFEPFAVIGETGGGGKAGSGAYDDSVG